MALRSAGMVLNAEGVSYVELTPPAGHSYLVRNIIAQPYSGTSVTVRIDRMTVGYWSNESSGLGSHLGRGNLNYQKDTLLKWLYDRGLWKGYPVAEGQTLRVEISTSNAFTGCVVYDDYDAGDITSNMQNGTDSDEAVYVVYGRPSSALASAGDVQLNTSLMPAEFCDFPFSGAVPARTTIEILGILAVEAAQTSTSSANDYVYTRALKLIRDREVLYDTQRIGIHMRGQPSGSANTTTVQTGTSPLGYYSHLYVREPYLLPQPIECPAGDELYVYITGGVGGSGASLSTANLTVGFIERVRIERR